MGRHRALVYAAFAAATCLSTGVVVKDARSVQAPRRVAVVSRVAPTRICAKYAAPSGRDDSQGSLRRPFKTVQRLADALQPGQTGCLRGGTYNGAGRGPYVLDVIRGGATSKRLTIQSFPGERATIVGIVDIPPGSDDVVLSSLNFRGTGAMNTIKIYASGVIVEDSDITNDWQGRSCMILGNDDSAGGPAFHPTIRRNRFHECGSPANTVFDHAIYAARAIAGRIVENIFWDSEGYAVQFYPDSHDNVFAHNVVDGGGRSFRGGVTIGGDENTASTGNVIEHNIIAYARTHDISTWWQSSVGSGNVARENCVWAAGSGDIDTSNGGIVALDNTSAKPAFTSRAGRDYRLRAGSRCLGVVGYDTAARLSAIFR